MRPRPPTQSTGATPSSTPLYPFTAIVGQEEMKLALLLNVIEPSIGGVLIMGERGTGKSTAVRSLAGLLPPLTRVRGCAYNCDPSDEKNLCHDCAALLAKDARFRRERAPVPVVDLPLGATEDRVCGTINLERALTEGVKAFEPGLLARANRGFLYIDEVNLLEDHLVDLLLDAAATGRNTVEREGISTAHPSRFVLVGSGNPEEGELRPQLLDRFGLYTEIRGIDDTDQRIEIVERREAFERDPTAFQNESEHAEAALRRRLTRAQTSARDVEMPRSLVRLIVELCARLKVDGHRGELTITRAARSLAAFEGRRRATETDVRRVAAMSLRHRLRRDPLEQTSGGTRINQTLDELSANDTTEQHTAHDGERHMRPNPRRRSSSDTQEDDQDPPGPARRRGATAGASQAATDAPRGNTSPAGGKARPEDAGNGTAKQHEERSAPPTFGRLPEDALDSSSRLKKPRAAGSSNTRARGRARSFEIAGRGRYVRAMPSRTAGAGVALDATLRTAAMHAPWRQAEQRGDDAAHGRSGALRIAPADLRYKQLRRKAGTLFILAVDTSGSMAANRINQAKGALVVLLRQSYVRRDRVALVAFRERDAQLLLPPSQSSARARRLLDALPVGGATPLAAGLARALEIAERASRAGAQRIVLVVFTDGRANVSLRAQASIERAARRDEIRLEIERLGEALQRAGVRAVVVDTQNRYTSGGEGKGVADALGGRYVYLPASRHTLDALTDEY